jgi:hypothetical protein
MSLVGLDGGYIVPIGPSMFGFAFTVPSTTAVVLDAANEANIAIGQIIWADGGTHTVDTSGSSSIGWRTGTSTFANAGTTVKVGLGTVDAANGPPGRATNVADVITFSVSKSMTGGGGGVASGAWQTHVPDTGSLAIANGDIVAMSVQMTARGGADNVSVTNAAQSNILNRPFVTSFTGGAYAAVAGHPNVMLTASDGTLGWFYGSMPFTSIGTKTANSGGAGATKEYGQLYKLPFPCKVYGIYANIDPDGDCDFVLYSDPLGTPVPEKTVSMDVNVVNLASQRMSAIMFATPYTLAAETPIVAAYKPGATNITIHFRTLASATHRVVDAGGTDSYGVNRDTSAFANDNSSLNHFFIGLLVGAWDDGASGSGRAIQINNPSLVA